MNDVFDMDDTELRAEVTRLRGIIERNGRRFKKQTRTLDECKRARHLLAKEVVELRRPAANSDAELLAKLFGRGGR